MRSIINSFNLKNINFYFILLIPVSMVAGNLILNLNIILIDILGLYLIYKNKKKIKIDPSLKILFILFVYVVFASLFSNYPISSFTKAIFYFKFFIFTFVLTHIFELNREYLRVFYMSLIICLVVVSFDGLLQRYSGENIFGWSLYNNRMTGLFKDEAVVGSYLSKFLFLGIGFFYIFKKNFDKNKIFEIFLILICFFTIINSGERMATLHTLLGLIIYLIINLLNFKKNLIINLVVFISCLFLLLNNQILKNRIDETFENRYGIGKSVREFKDSQWGAHYLTSIEIFKENPIFGSGFKTFKMECKKFDQIDSKKKEFRCSTHSHNYILEILSETGILGLFLFLLFLYHLISFKNIRKKLSYIIVIPLLIYLWPIGTSGSLFSTFNGTFFFIIISVIVTLKKEKILI